MKKLLDLGPKEFSYGITTADHLDGPIFSTATAGVCSLYDDSSKRGLLMAGPDANNVGSTDVVDTIITGAINSSGGTTTLYSLGASGHLYSQSMATPTATPTDHRSGTPITNPANGLETFQAAGGSRYLYYWQKTQIGRWDMSQAYPAGWTDNWETTNITDTYAHPTHSFQDRVYYGNGAYVGYIYDNAGTPTSVPRALDVPADYYVSSITDDGTYLVIGLTRQTGSGTFQQSSGGKIIFWDGVSSSWSKEWNLPDSTGIISLKNVDGSIYVLETRRLSVCNFSTPPISINLEGYLRAPMTGSGAATSDHNRMVKYKDGVLWINNVGGLSYYGKLHPDAPRALHSPFGPLTSPTAILPIGVTSYIHVGGQSKYYAQATAGGGTSGSVTTRFFDLKDTYTIGRIDLVFGYPLASGDTVTVNTVGDATTGTLTFGIASFATHGAKTKVPLHTGVQYGNHTMDSLQLVLAWGAGAVKIKRIIVWGDPVE